MSCAKRRVFAQLFKMMMGASLPAPQLRMAKAEAGWQWS